MEESSEDSDFSLPYFSSDKDNNTTQLCLTHTHQDNSDTSTYSTKETTKDGGARKPYPLPSELPRSSPSITPQPDDTSLAIRPFPLEEFLRSSEFLAYKASEESDQEGTSLSASSLRRLIFFLPPRSYIQ